MIIKEKFRFSVMVVEKQDRISGFKRFKSVNMMVVVFSLKSGVLAEILN